MTEVQRYGIGDLMECDPVSALTMCLMYAAGEVEYYTRRIQELPEGGDLVRPATMKRVDVDGPAAGRTTETTGAEELHVYIVARGQGMDGLQAYAKTALELGYKNLYDYDSLQKLTDFGLINESDIPKFLESFSTDENNYRFYLALIRRWWRLNRNL